MSRMWALPPTRSALAAEPAPDITPTFAFSVIWAKLRPILIAESSALPATPSAPNSVTRSASALALAVSPVRRVLW